MLEVLSIIITVPGNCIHILCILRASWCRMFHKGEVGLYAGCTHFGVGGLPEMGIGVD